MLSRQALLVAARARAQRAADAAELAWFASEVAEIRVEILEARAELACFKKLLGLETVTERHDHEALH
jgi:hypothetical protein